MIHINQLGYRPNDAKKAVLPAEAREFMIMRTDGENAVLQGIPGEPIEDSASRETARIADFSALTQTGEYSVCAGSVRSHPFIIADAPYKEARRALLDFFNYQKCGADLECGLWSHPACHTAPAAVYGTGEKKDVSGGWHDAGDYGRYIVPAAKAVADLLLAHEFSPNPDNDLLDIVWFEIEWMLKMQDARSGGVYHKVSCRQFNALNEMPDKEKDELVLAPISSAATADFAAAMALSSRFYPGKKELLLKAAVKAWDWLIANPDAKYINPKDIRTGGYEVDNDKDNRLWAACELFAALKNETYHGCIKKEINANHVYEKKPWFPYERRLLSGLGWGNMGTYAVISYLSRAGEKANKEITQKMKAELIKDCEHYMENCKTSPYGISLGEFFPWGSNMNICNNAMALIMGSKFAADGGAKKTEYLEAAREHFNYLFGKNPLSQCYVTGFGSKPVLNPHHRPSAAKGKAAPGMVAGGPCGHFNHDPAVKEYCDGAPPSKRYIDDKESFSTNEITIYWNSPAYFLAAALGY